MKMRGFGVGLTMVFSLVAGGLHTLLATSVCRAGVPAFVGNRSEAMGGALRGQATGSSAALLNPSGLMLSRSYTLEAAYQFDRPDGGHLVHVSVADSTSAFGFGGALYYTYTSPASSAALDPGGRFQQGHETGLALAFPLGKLVLGTTAKYFRLETPSALVEGSNFDDAGFSVDAGATLSLSESLRAGLVGYNLAGLENPRARLAVGGGVALSLKKQGLVVAADALWVDQDPDDRSPFHFMGGAEYLLPQGIGFRAGGGRDGDREAGYVSGGVSLFQAQVGAIDLTLRQEITGETATRIGVSARLFVAAP